MDPFEEVKQSGSSSKDKYNEQFNKFQKDFYTSISNFSSYTYFEYKKFGFILLNNVAKGFPALSQIVTDLRGFGWIGFESPEILKALQKKFVNMYSMNKIPQFVYYKNNKQKKLAKSDIKETKDGKIFSDEVNREICRILQYDSKTFDYLKFSSKVQYLGCQITGEYINQELIKRKKSSKVKL